MSAVKRTMVLVGLALVMGIGIFLSFDRLFSDATPSYAVNIAAAFLGTVITIVITAILLNAQSMSELGKEKSVGVFRAKLAMYTEFLEFLNNVVRDGGIDEAELKEIRGWALKMSLVCGAHPAQTIAAFIDQTMSIGGFRWGGLDETQKKKWFDWYARYYGGEPDIIDGMNVSFISIGRIIAALKIDLGEENVSSNDEAFGNFDAIDEIMAEY